MMWTRIADIPRSAIVEDTKGYTWEFRHGAWGFRREPQSQWTAWAFPWQHQTLRIGDREWGPYFEDRMA